MYSLFRVTRLIDIIGGMVGLFLVVYIRAIEFGQSRLTEIPVIAILGLRCRVRTISFVLVRCVENARAPLSVCILT